MLNNMTPQSNRVYSTSTTLRTIFSGTDKITNNGLKFPNLKKI